MAARQRVVEPAGPAATGEPMQPQHWRTTVYPMPDHASGETVSIALRPLSRPRTPIATAKGKVALGYLSNSARSDFK
jgi:hypothetical protein